MRRQAKMDRDILQVEKKGNLCVLILNRPEKRNALSPDLLQLLHQALQDLSRDERIRALIIRGAGEEAFCAGFDIGALGGEPEAISDYAAVESHPLDRVFRCVEDYPFPVLAMLNGSAYGGGYELALCCDIRIAADDIRIGVSAGKLGIVYPWQGIRRFVQVLGPAVARQMLFTARAFQGPEIAQMGLADHVVARRDLEDFTFRMAEQIAANSPLSLKGAKQTLNLLLRSWSLSENDREQAEALTIQSMLSPDLSEARAAFLKKRKPK